MNANEPVKNKTGRKRLDSENGEIRDEKVTVYFTSQTMTKFKNLCSMKNTSCANYLFELACNEIARNTEALDFFNQAMSKVK